MLMRILLIACMAAGLSSCGTATHMIGQASGLLSTVTAPVTGILRLSESPETSPEKEKTATPARHDRQRPQAQRQR